MRVRATGSLSAATQSDTRTAAAISAWAARSPMRSPGGFAVSCTDGGLDRVTDGGNGAWVRASSQAFCRSSATMKSTFR